MDLEITLISKILFNYMMFLSKIKESVGLNIHTQAHYLISECLQIDILFSKLGKSYLVLVLYGEIYPSATQHAL